MRRIINHNAHGVAMRLNRATGPHTQMTTRAIASQLSKASKGPLPLASADQMRYSRLPMTRSANRGTTSPGYVNSKGQRVLRATGLAGTDHGQYVYVLNAVVLHGVRGQRIGHLAPEVPAMPGRSSRSCVARKLWSGARGHFSTRVSPHSPCGGRRCPTRCRPSLAFRASPSTPKMTTCEANVRGTWRDDHRRAGRRDERTRWSVRSMQGTWSSPQRVAERSGGSFRASRQECELFADSWTLNLRWSS
jgi:hypothetical protein